MALSSKQPTGLALICVLILLNSFGLGCSKKLMVIKSNRAISGTASEGQSPSDSEAERNLQDGLILYRQNNHEGARMAISHVYP